MNKDYNDSTSAFSQSQKRDEQLLKKYSPNINSLTRTDFLKLISELELRNEKLKSQVNDLKESEKLLQDINANKDKFFSIISHDLRSPFSSIIAFSNLLVEKVRERDYKRVEEYAGIIHSSSWRVMNLLVNLIEWSSSQTGRIEFKPEYIDIVELINEVVELFNDSAISKAINISCDFPASAIIFADKEMIGTVLRNLISNAIKYSHQGSSIYILVNQNQKELKVSVRDTGVGIPQETIKKLFLIEESYSTRGTYKETGTGLGLLLCKEFVEKHGGELLIESKQGKGSTFTSIFPVSH